MAKKSQVWEYFSFRKQDTEIDKTITVCNICCTIFDFIELFHFCYTKWNRTEKNREPKFCFLNRTEPCLNRDSPNRLPVDEMRFYLVGWTKYVGFIKIFCNQCFWGVEIRPQSPSEFPRNIPKFVGKISLSKF